jgi:hypothetical protein
MSNITSFRQKFSVPELEILKGKCDRNNTLPKTLLKEYPLPLNWCIRDSNCYIPIIVRLGRYLTFRLPN